MLQLRFGQSIIDCIWARLLVRLVTFLIKMSLGYKCNMYKEILRVGGIHHSRADANTQHWAVLSYPTINEIHINIRPLYENDSWDQLKVWKI